MQWTKCTTKEWHALMGGPASWSYDHDKTTGYLRMRDGCCCDMTACLRFFQNIDPHVHRIQTFGGEWVDTQYWTTSKGWTSGDVGFETVQVVTWDPILMVKYTDKGVALV